MSEFCERCRPPVEFAGPNALDFKLNHDAVVHSAAREASIAYAREQTAKRDAAAARQAAQKGAAASLKAPRTRKSSIEPTVRTKW